MHHSESNADELRVTLVPLDISDNQSIADAVRFVRTRGFADTSMLPCLCVSNVKLYIAFRTVHTSLYQ